jgi:hypothetical protein
VFKIFEPEFTSGNNLYQIGPRIRVDEKAIEEVEEKERLSQQVPSKKKLPSFVGV